jgi:hypothetical protein
MSGPTLKPSQRVAVAASIPSQSAAAVQSSGWVDMSKFYSVMALVSLGALGAAATVDAKLQQATDSGGTGTKDIAGKAIAQFTKGNNDDNKQAVINLKQEDLDLANGFQFVKLVITPAVAASQIDGKILGFDPRYGPADGQAAATQTQVVG